MLPDSKGHNIKENRLLKSRTISTPNGQVRFDILPDKLELEEEFTKVTTVLKSKTLATEAREYLMTHKHEIKFHSISEYMSWWKDHNRQAPGREVCSYSKTFPDVPDEYLPDEVHEWGKQLHNPRDRYSALNIYGPSRTGKTFMARQFGRHLYFRLNSVQGNSRELHSCLAMEHLPALLAP